MNIGKAVKQLRKKQNLNQQELAALCGMTQTALSQIENGSRRPNQSSLRKLAEVFKVPEIVLYMLAAESSDIPAEKRDMFDRVFPNMQTMMLDIFE